MGIELEFTSSVSRPSSNRGSVVPSWYNNEDNYSTWYKGNAPFQYYYWYNMLTSNNSNEMYIQYGTNAEGWGSGRFFVQDLEIQSQTENSDGSISVTVRSRMRRFRQRITEMTGGGFNVNYTLKILGNTVFTYNGTASDRINEGSSNWYTKTFIIEPQETLDSTGIEFKVSYPDGDAKQSTLFLGFGLFNPNPLTYIPMSIRKSGSWKDLNSNNGEIKRRISNSWSDKSEENVETSRDINKGKNRIRRSGNWRQLPRMNGGNAP